MALGGRADSEVKRRVFVDMQIPHFFEAARILYERQKAERGVVRSLV